MSTNSEVTECAVMTSSPQDSTFGQDWNDQLIKIGRNRLTSTINQQMWSRAACSYNDHVEISNRDVHYGPLIAGESALRLLPSIRNSRVLDLGCGAGHNLAALSHAGASSGLGIDFSGDQAKQARARLPGTFQVVEADITVYDFAAAGPFDLALSVFSVPFVPDLTALLGAAARSLRRGGTLLLSTNHPCRSIEPPTDRAAEPRCRSGVRRLWSFPGLPLLPFFHYLHDLPTIISALANAGLVVEAIVEPRALPMAQLAAAPYQSAYYVSRHEELSRAPYTLILKARKL
jgi:SAM-dependent methyltransferase